MKTLKRSLSVLLAALLLTACCVPALAADKDDPKQYPTIIISGYSSSYLAETLDDGTKNVIWKLDFGQLPEMLLANIADIALDAGLLLMGDASYIAETFIKQFLPVVEKMRMNDDGSSTYNVDSYLTTPEELNIANLRAKYPDGKYQAYIQMVDLVAEQMGGYDHLYYCYNDFRRSVLDCSDRLDQLIEGVCEREGTDKVNIVAQSHGGQIAAFYIARYGYKNRIHNVVLNVPAIGGAGLAWDPFSGAVHLDLDTLLTFIENGTMMEVDIDWLTKAAQSGLIDNIISKLLPGTMDYIKNWGSLWDFVPADKYDEFRAMYGDEAHAEMLEKADIVHYEIMPVIGEKLNEAIERGARINIVCGTNARVVTGMEVNSDGIIPVYCATNATCAPIGERFSDGYRTLGTTCSDPTHNHLSPAMDVDASTCWLPENTWFVNGMFHGMEAKDPYTYALIGKLIGTREITDVHSSPEFTQFHASTNRQYGAAVRFNRSVEGYCDKKDNALIVTNISDQYPMQLLSVSVSGAELYFTGVRKTAELAPGESVEIAFTGSLPTVSLKRINVTLTFRHSGNPTPVSYRTVPFTVMNGEPVEYDASNPYEGYKASSVLHLQDNTLDILKAAGVLELLEMVYNIFEPVFKVLETLYKFVVG